MQMEPIDLKKAAKRFTEKYHPDWVSRFDRIWDMFEKINPKSLVADSANSQSQMGNAFGITGTADPSAQECMGGIAVFAFTYQDTKDKSSISQDEVKKKISMVPVNLNMYPGLQKKLEDVVNEMLPSMVVGAAEQTEKKDSNEYDEIKYFIVYLSRKSGFGVQKILVDEDELHSEYLSNKKIYDIIVYNQNVEIKSVVKIDGVEKIHFKSTELYANILHLLILFLKYKDENLPFLNLYHSAWQGGAEYKADVTDSDDIIDDVKTGVSSLRKYLKKVKNFVIPNAKKKTKAYVCKGEFQFCLVLKSSMDQIYTLEVD